MILESVALLLLISGAGERTSSLTDVAEKWVNSRNRSFEQIHLSRVKATEDGFICAFSYNDDRYLIDARRRITWVDTVAFSGWVLDPDPPSPHTIYGMTPDRKEQWSRCEKAGSKH